MNRVKTAVFGGAVSLAFCGLATAGSITVDYDAYVGGNGGSSTGMSAQATWTVIGNQLTIELSNTSTGAPGNATSADQVLVSLAFDMSAYGSILSGDAIEIAAGSIGLGLWDGLVGGDSIAEQWIWSNTGHGDYLAGFPQVISTSSGHGGGTPNAFGGGPVPDVDGPWGGAVPTGFVTPDDKRAVDNSIFISLTLSAALTGEQLQAIADAAVVEFGSDFAYVSTVPAPSALAVLALGLGGRSRRRRHA